MKFAFAGDRDIAVAVLEFMMEEGCRPSALLVSGPDRASHAEDLTSLSGLPESHVLSGKEFSSPESVALLRGLELDYIIGVHFPYIISPEVLNIPSMGFLNLHPAYLPFNKGWHTPSWALLEKTPIGATLHFMSEQLDAGDIICQRELEVLPEDTANSLYARLKALEIEVFKEAFSDLKQMKPQRLEQNLSAGTSHLRKELFSPDIQELSLSRQYGLDELLDKLRALTTNNINEAAYFIKNNKKYRIQVTIVKED